MVDRGDGTAGVQRRCSAREGKNIAGDRADRRSRSDTETGDLLTSDKAADIRDLNRGGGSRGAESDLAEGEDCSCATADERGAGLVVAVRGDQTVLDGKDSCRTGVHLGL